MSTEKSNVVGAWCGIVLPERGEFAGESVALEPAEDVAAGVSRLRFGALELEYVGGGDSAGAGEYQAEEFTLRSVTTRVSGRAHVLTGSFFGQHPEAETGARISAAVLELEPEAEVAFTCDDSFEHAMVACTSGLQFDNVDVPAGSYGRTGAGHTTHAVKNTGRERAVAVLLGGNPADRAGAASAAR